MRLFCPAHRPRAPYLALEEAISAQSLAQTQAEDAVTQIDGATAELRAAAGRSQHRLTNRRTKDPNIANALEALKQILERH